MSRLCPVAVRIVRRGDVYLVIARRGVVAECATLDLAWAASLPYFAGRKQ